ncbi:MAG: dehydrogenase [Bacteroidales bacterium]|nr:dehydrogenase [Bacteroidales bacterium]MBP3254795.1 dehydrogenase [Bacteroidales bacterium]
METKKNLIIRAKAPLRLGLAGGGTDVSPYSDMYGGLVLNATINLYAHCILEVTDTNTIEIFAKDIDKKEIHNSAKTLPINGTLDLGKGVYNRIVKDFNLPALSFKMTTYSDAPAGSGLGSSSTMVVCILKVFVEWLKLPVGDYELARLAYEIERLDLNLSGGKQDQYAAAFGGFNYMEFLKDDMVIVNPLKIKRWIVDELEESMVLYYTGASRQSAQIIDEQKNNTKNGNTKTIDSLHKIKQSAKDMKQCLLFGDINGFASIIRQGWEDKKRLAKSISNEMIDGIMETAYQNGALAGKVSGAGGGGFITFICKPEDKCNLIKALSKLDGDVIPFQFSDGGPHGWTIY